MPPSAGNREQLGGRRRREPIDRRDADRRRRRTDDATPAPRFHRADGEAPLGAKLQPAGEFQRPRSARRRRRVCDSRPSTSVSSTTNRLVRAGASSAASACSLCNRASTPAGAAGADGSGSGRIADVRPTPAAGHAGDGVVPHERAAVSRRLRRRCHVTVAPAPAAGAGRRVGVWSRRPDASELTRYAGNDELARSAAARRRLRQGEDFDASAQPAASSRPCWRRAP